MIVVWEIHWRAVIDEENCFLNADVSRVQPISTNSTANANVPERKKRTNMVQDWSIFFDLKTRIESNLARPIHVVQL